MSLYSWLFHFQCCQLWAISGQCSTRCQSVHGLQCKQFPEYCTEHCQRVLTPQQLLRKHLSRWIPRKSGCFEKLLPKYHWNGHELCVCESQHQQHSPILSRELFQLLCSCAEFLQHRSHINFQWILRTLHQSGARFKLWIHQLFNEWNSEYRM